MLSKHRIYIAGPMTGLPDMNFPAFNDAAQRWRNAGWDVVNPAENFEGRQDLPRSSYMRADVSSLLQCSAIAFLPGWVQSKGARLEFLLACELDLEIFDANTMGPLRIVAQVVATPAESILDEAKRLTSTDRQGSYGHPRDDFSRTAQMWTGILASKLRPGQTISASDIPLCMIAVKLAREAYRHKRDNLVDIAGYARTEAMVAGDE